MNGLLNIISTAVSLPNKQFTQLLNGIEDHQCFSQKSTSELDVVVSLITNCLNSHDKKYEGLLLLRSFLIQCQLDIVEQKGNLWLTLCTKICAQKQTAALVNLSYEAISDILTRSIHLPDLGKAISSNFLSKIIENVNGQSIECHLAALKCLERCMKHYAGPSGSSRAIIERFLLSFIDSSNRAHVIQSGKCLQQLQQVRGGNVQGISQKNAWIQLQMQLLGSLHKILNQIFANTRETYDGYQFDDEIASLKIAELNLSAEPIERANQLFTRFRNLCDYLRIALCEPFSVSKAIQPGLILSLISRGLAVNCTTLSKNLITDNVAVGALIPKIHVSLFQLLDSLVLVLRSNLLPYANDICKIVIQSLKWTSSGKASGFRRPYTSIRQSAYQTLSLWCKTMKYGSLVETVAEDLLKSIIQDITPFQSEVTLKVLSGSRKYLSKKARQKLHKAQNDASNITRTHSKAFNPHNTKIIYTDYGNEPLCSAALGCLTEVLNSVGCFLKPFYQKILQENILAIALDVANAPPKQSNLYFNSKTRSSLYTVLFALVQSPHHLCPPPLQYAIEIFSIAQIMDNSREIRDKCNEYLRGMEKIIHPQKETFFFPTDVNEVAEIFKKDRNADRSGIAADNSESDNEDEDIVMNELISSSNEQATEEAILEPISNTAQLKQNETEESNEQKKAPEIIIQVLTCEEEKISTTENENNDKSASLTINVESTPIVEEKSLISPPRKSARLSAKRRLSSTDCDSSGSRCDSPVPRRRSTRLNSSSVQETPKLDDKNKKLTPIIELSTAAEKTENKTALKMQESGDGTKTKAEDELVDELASAFVEEFIDNE